MCTSVVQRVGVFYYPPLWYITLYVQELLKTTILETSIVPRIMLYTLWSLLCVCLFIKQLRNPHLLWIFRKFLPNILMHPSFPRVHLTEGWDWGLTPVLPLHSLAHWPEQGLQRLRLDFKQSAAGLRQIWSSPPLGRFWWELLMGVNFSLCPRTTRPEFFRNMM